ncbi:MAG TPA: BBE domain-containing protein [Actinomycetes bacterium]|nr:BBE domain-containing protein [Actinomycetes bacterium]
MRRLPEEATAFSGRGAGYALNINAVASDGDALPAQAAWARRTWEAMRPHGNGVYVNFLDREGNHRVRAAYGPAKYNRLTALKRAWDHGNLFRLNQNVTPD